MSEHQSTISGRLAQFFLMSLAAVILLAACQTAGVAVSNETGEELRARQVTEYRLGTGDQVRIIVFGEEQLSGEFVVDGTGAISLPLIGEIHAAGTSLRELQRAIETSLRDGYLNDPRVSAEVLNYRPYYILGEVGQAGEYPYSDGLTVLNAVATAGGFTYRANSRIVYIKRSDSANEEQFPLTATTPVRPGDTIRIAERYF